MLQFHVACQIAQQRANETGQEFVVCFVMSTQLYRVTSYSAWLISSDVTYVARFSSRY